MALSLPLIALNEKKRLVVTIPRVRTGLSLEDLNRLKDLGGTGPSAWPRCQIDWVWAKQLRFKGRIHIDHETLKAVDAVLAEARKQITPLYPLPPELSLGWVIDQPSLVAKINDFNLGFTAGVEYALTVAIVPVKDRRKEISVRSAVGTLRERVLFRRGHRLQLKLQGAGPVPYMWLEGHDKPEDFLARFQVPEVPPYAEVEAAKLAKAYAAVLAVEAKYGAPRGWRLRDWQRDDIARAAALGRSILAWEMGGGKSLGSLCLALTLQELGAPSLALFITPQDLISQWRAEARRRFGLDMVIVDSAAAVQQAIKERKEGRTFAEPPMTAREVRSFVRARGRGFFITHFEAISRSGRVDEKDNMTQERTRYVKSGYSALTTAFKKGLIVVDEVTKLKGETTHISHAVRGMRAKYRLALTGTPVSNLLVDIFWLLWWSIGNQTPRFPYTYKDGQRAFFQDFGTTETSASEGKKRDEQVRRDKATTRRSPDPSNVLILRRILSSCVLRRRMDDVSTPVSCRYITVSAPWGSRQREQYRNWLDPERFAAYWKEKFPYTNFMTIDKLRAGAALGQFSHLEYATTCPEAELETFGDPRWGKDNWTPKNLRVLETIRSHVRAGEKVLFGSAVVALVPWISDRLREVGIRTECLTEQDKKGKHVSLGPRDRTAAIERFLGTSGQVLCAGLNAMALGHNLDTVSTVVVAGLPWPFSTLAQFLARVRRYSSVRDITAHIVMTEGSLDEKKWDLLERKRIAAGKVLDVVDLVREEEPVSLEEVLAELVARGVASGPEVDEGACKTAWEEHARRGVAILATDGVELVAARPGATLRSTIWHQSDVAGAPSGLPAPSSRVKSIADLAGALSSGYRVPFWTGHQAGRDESGMFVLVDRARRQLERGPAFEVALMAESETSAAQVTKACRLARMPPEERLFALAWWTKGSWQTELVPADAVWWRHGVWASEIELPESKRLKPELLSTQGALDPWSSSNGITVASLP